MPCNAPRPAGQAAPLEVSPGVPVCFSSARQFRTWSSAASRTPPGDSQYCADCTPRFQALRIRQRRCGFPGTTFHQGVDGFVDGVRPGCRLPLGPQRNPNSNTAEDT